MVTAVLKSWDLKSRAGHKWSVEIILRANVHYVRTKDYFPNAVQSSGASETLCPSYANALECVISLIIGKDKLDEVYGTDSREQGRGMKIPETKEERLVHNIIEIARIVSRSDIPSDRFDIVFNRVVDEYIARLNNVEVAAYEDVIDALELKPPVSEEVIEAFKRGIESAMSAKTVAVRE